MIIVSMEYNAKLSEVPEENRPEILKIWTLKRDWSVHYYDWPALRLTIDEAARLEELLGFKLKIDALAPLQFTPAPGKGRSDTTTAELLSGAATTFHVAELGLLHIRQVSWLEDACTEELQDMLDAGWRILAVCPPRGQRRPDYILGRSDKV